MTEPTLYNACELYAENAKQAEEARQAWETRGTTLEIMYTYIDGLQAAKLESKNYIYSVLCPIIGKAIRTRDEKKKKALETYLQKIKAFYHRPTDYNAAFTVCFDYEPETPQRWIRIEQQQQKMIRSYAGRAKCRIETKTEGNTKYFYIYT